MKQTKITIRNNKRFFNWILSNFGCFSSNGLICWTCTRLLAQFLECFFLVFYILDFFTLSFVSWYSRCFHSENHDKSHQKVHQLIKSHGKDLLKERWKRKPKNSFHVFWTLISIQMNKASWRRNNTLHVHSCIETLKL